MKCHVLYKNARRPQFTERSFKQLLLKMPVVLQNCTKQVFTEINKLNYSHSHSHILVYS